MRKSTKSKAAKKLKNKLMKKIIVGMILFFMPLFSIMFLLIMLTGGGDTSTLPELGEDVVARYKELSDKITFAVGEDNPVVHHMDWELHMAYDLAKAIEKGDETYTLYPDRSFYELVDVTYKQYGLREDENTGREWYALRRKKEAHSEAEVKNLLTELLRSNKEHKFDENNAIKTHRGFAYIVTRMSGFKERIIYDFKDLRDIETMLTPKGLEAFETIVSKGLITRAYGNYTSVNLPSHIDVADGTFMAWVTPNITRITSNFGWRQDPKTGKKRHHNGIDIASPGCEGKPIISALDGEVVFRQLKTSGYGYNVKVRSEDKEGNIWIARYCHMHSISVEKGDKVEKGDVLGSIGNTGKSTGPHLHFEVKLNGKYINPLIFFNSDEEVAED